MKASETPRALALRSLTALERDGRYANLEIDARLNREGVMLSPADRALYTRLVYGVTEKRITIDYILDQYASRPAAEMDADLLGALRMGVYQLLWMDRIPPHAAVSETVGLVRGGRAGFANAVLRSFLRAGKIWKLPEGEENRILALSVRHSVPEALVLLYESALRAEEGDKSGELDELLSALNREPKTCLRVNTLRLTALEAARQLGGEISEIAPDVVKIDALTEEARRGIERGDWFVEDEASRITALAVGAKPGEAIADTCACPGGKTFSMALDMHGEGVVHAYDLHGNKLSLVKRGAERLGLSTILTEERDAREPDPALFLKMDRVLCDAPCSGYGIIAKKPDVRYKDPASVSHLPAVQRAVLEGASAYVRPGGTLVYSTCTLNPAENGEIVRAFLSEHGEFSLTSCEALGASMKTFYPHRDGTDGFFAAVMGRSRE